MRFNRQKDQLSRIGKRLRDEKSMEIRVQDEKSRPSGQNLHKTNINKDKNMKLLATNEKQITKPIK